MSGNSSFLMYQTNAGIISAKLAEQFATEQYDLFHQKRLSEPQKNDFDYFVEQNEKLRGLDGG